MRVRTATIALLVAAALGAAACGEDENTTATPAAQAPAATTTVVEPDVTVEAPAATATETTPAPSTATTTPKSSSSSKAISKDTKTKPSIPKPAGKKPTTLVSRDIVKGKGPSAKAGDPLTMQYVGISYSTGEQFDASWDRGQPFQFQLGAQMVIPGWDEGIAGMKAGGRRELIIPPDLAYGPQGQPPAIGPNETLVFVVDLVSIG